MKFPTRVASFFSGLFLYGCLSLKSYQPLKETAPEVVFIKERQIHYIPDPRSESIAYQVCAFALYDYHNRSSKTLDEINRAPTYRCEQDWLATRATLEKIGTALAEHGVCKEVGMKEIADITEQILLEAQLAQVSTSSVTCASPLPSMAEYIPASSSKDRP